MMIKKLPTQPSPPKMSIFWSTPYPDKKYSGVQLKTCYLCGGNKFTCDCPGHELEDFGFFPYTETTIVGYTEFGKEHNWVGARKIRYKGTDIRVFPDEFSVLKQENLKEYVMGSHDLVLGESPEDDFDTKLMARSLEKDEVEIRDAALMDGCDDQQSKLVALGMDFTVPDSEFPPIGWYRCKKEYAEVYCNDWELKEE